MDYFGGRNVCGLIGILYTSVAFGTLIGPSAAGFAFDLSHSYTLPILASAAANIVAAIIVAATSTERPRRRASLARERRLTFSLTQIPNLTSISARYPSAGLGARNCFRRSSLGSDQDP